MVRVLIADDHQMFVDGVRLMLQEAEGFEVAGHANNGKEAINVLEKEAVDVILLDIDMPEMGAEDTLEIMRKRSPETKALIVTMHDEGPYIKKYMELDVDGYILKNTNKEELLFAIRNVHAGKQYFGSDLLKKASLVVQETNGAENGKDNLLTEREKEIVQLTANDFSIPQIADKLYISVNTVKTHRKNIQHKIEAKSLAGIIRYAIEHGLADSVEDT